MKTYNKNDPETIQEMFDSIAQNYDKTNSILSFQRHKYWNQQLINEVLLKQTKQMPEQETEHVLDLCCGTGAISLEYLKQIKGSGNTPPSKIYLLDFSAEMLSCARSKAEADALDHYDITYFQADAKAIPLPDHYVDKATMAYGIRNIKDPQECLNEVYRVLRTDGVFGILELTEPANPFLRFGHSLYLRTLLPVLGKMFTSNKQAYRYLCNSIHSFIPPKTLKSMMESSGFKDLQCIPLMGGIATILTGTKKAS